MNAALAQLQPPRKHYQWYYSTREANDDMRHCAAGPARLPARLLPLQERRLEAEPAAPAQVVGRAANWPNCPPITSWISTRDMAQTVAAEMPSAAEIAACEWLPERELAVYSAEYARTGFQGGLQWYRCATSGKFTAELQIFSGRTHRRARRASSPEEATGASTRSPATSRKCRQSVCASMLGCHLVDGAGHWVQQEQPEEVSKLLLDFLATAG